MPRLLAELEAAFPAATIYTPADHGGRGTLDWPSMDELADAGKRVIVASAADYGEVGPAPPARQASGWSALLHYVAAIRLRVLRVTRGLGLPVAPPSCRLSES